MARAPLLTTDPGLRWKFSLELHTAVIPLVASLRAPRVDLRVMFPRLTPFRQMTWPQLNLLMTPRVRLNRLLRKCRLVMVSPLILVATLLSPLRPKVRQAVRHTPSQSEATVKDRLRALGARPTVK